MRRVVIVRLSALGDTLLTLPALEAARARWPEATITLVTAGALAPLFEGHPALDEVVAWRRDRHSGWGGARRLVAGLRARGPVDLYIDLQNKLRTRLWGWLLRPKRRWVFRKRSALEGLAALLGRDRPRVGRHATQLYLDLIAPSPTAPSRAPVYARLPPQPLPAELGALPAGLIGLAPGARHGTKRWAPERFAEVAAALGRPVVLVGGPEERPLLDACAAALPTPPLFVGDGLDLPGLAALLQRCELLITNDTGPGHLAAAVGTPTLSVFGPTPPSRWRPAHPAAAVAHLELPCMPCSNHGGARCPLEHHGCMEQLSAEQVRAQALALLGEAR